MELTISIKCIIFVVTCVAVCRSNPHPRKGELMEVVLRKETQGKYEEALNAFAEIGKLARDSTVNLSIKERKIFYDCYQYRQIQQMKEVVDSDNYLDQNIADSIMGYFSKIEAIYQDLSTNLEKENKPEFDGFLAKLRADQSHFDAWYFRKQLEVPVLESSFGLYDQALSLLILSLGEADITVLDTYLGHSTTKLELNTIFQATADPSPCETAKEGLVKGRKASSEGNPDLTPLTQFVNTHCKPNAPNVLDKYSFKRKL